MQNALSNYPDDIRSHDHDPRSPFYRDMHDHEECIKHNTQVALDDQDCGDIIDAIGNSSADFDVALMLAYQADDANAFLKVVKDRMHELAAAKAETMDCIDDDGSDCRD